MYCTTTHDYGRGVAVAAGFFSTTVLYYRYTGVPQAYEYTIVVKYCKTQTLHGEHNDIQKL
jgi:hypothetical protein